MPLASSTLLLTLLMAFEKYDDDDDDGDDDGDAGDGDHEHDGGRWCGGDGSDDRPRW